MRITAGKFRGRVLHVPSLPGLRPTSARVREALFDMLRHRLGDFASACMLDLYAGSGIMALEALSRGFAHVSSIEIDRRACRAMRQQARKLGIHNSQWSIQTGSLPSALHRLQGERFSLIFADPPYHDEAAMLLPRWLQTHAIGYHLLVIETASTNTPEHPSGLPMENIMSRRYGNTRLSMFRPCVNDG